MPGGLTDTGIVNLALVDLGQPALASLSTDDNRAARVMRALYEPTVLEILRGHPWRCCQRMATLSEDPDADDPFDFDVACALPPDFVRVVKVNNNIDKFRVVGLHLQIDDDAPKLTYVARVPTAQFDASLVAVIAARLAMRSCVAITDNATNAGNLGKVYETVLADAKFNDSTDGAPEDAPMGTWAQARLSEA